MLGKIIISVHNAIQAFCHEFSVAFSFRIYRILAMPSTYHTPANMNSSSKFIFLSFLHKFPFTPFSTMHRNKIALKICCKKKGFDRILAMCLCISITDELQLKVRLKLLESIVKNGCHHPLASVEHHF